MTEQDTLTVKVKDGLVYVAEDVIGASLLVEGKEAYGEFGLNDGLKYEMEGRSDAGGSIGLDAAQIKWHGGIVDLNGGDNYKPVAVKEVDTFTFKGDKILTPQVEAPTRGVVWADVTLDGKTFTTNRVFLDLLPYKNLAKGAEITADQQHEAVPNLTDGKLIEADRFDRSKWSVPGNEKAWIQFKLPAKHEISNIDINFNTLDQNYINTPKTMKIQTSVDGVTWKDAGTVNGPTGTAYFGFYDQYPLSAQARYVKLVFDGGSNGSTTDLLEVAINGV
ncbi:discoidin domain-containing protein [Streptomyces sp. R-74717]|uniref:discoidin domain-containing protein n=1 Tax=Streptomyces TaxID=1883 RepID=UPI0037B14E9C